MNRKALALVVSMLVAAPLVAQAGLVQNASFENPLASWSNTAANYMAVAGGSPAITGWDVIQANGRGVAWAKNPTNDGYFASDGNYFVDLSGFGTEAGPNARLTQMLQNLIAGETYTIGVDYWGDRAMIAIGGAVLVTAGSASSGWARLTTSFQASGSQALLAIGYVGGSGVAFVDNVSVSGPDASANGRLPEPGSLALAGTALAAAAGLRRRRALKA